MRVATMWRGSISDDIRPAEKILAQVEFLNEHPEYIAVCGGFSMISDGGRVLSELNSQRPSGDMTEDLLFGRGTTHMGTYVIRTAKCRDLRFREWFKSAPDMDFQFRLAERGSVYFLQGNFFQYRLAEGSITHTMATERREFFHNVATRFAEQRRSGGIDDLERGCPPTPPSEGSGRATGHRDHQSRILVGEAWAQFAKGKRTKALQTLLRAIATDPFRPGIWRQFVVMLVKCVHAPLRRHH